MIYELQGVKGPRPHIYEDTNGNTICKLHQPIDFTCVVDGKTLTALLTDAEDDGSKWLYHILFSDGYKGVFTINRKKGRVVEEGQKASSTYAKAIENDIKTIYQFNPLHPHPFCLLVDVKGEWIKVWAKQEKSGSWFVYYKNQYHFFLHLFTGKWQCEPLDNFPNICVEPQIVSAVTERLKETIKFSLAPTN